MHERVIKWSTLHKLFTVSEENEESRAAISFGDKKGDESAALGAQDIDIIFSYLLPICRRTRKPPVEDDIKSLILSHQRYAGQPWKKVSNIVWRRYQSENRRQLKTAGKLIQISGQY
jgi:hypothetical protein